MQLKLETPVTEGRVLKERKIAAEDITAELGSDRNDGLLDTAMPIMIAAYGAAIAIVTYTFWQSGDALLSIAVCAVYMVMFFGVPIVMARVRNRHDDRWCSESTDAAADRVAIFGGSIGRNEAVLQMVIVPLAVVFAFAAFAVIWLSLKP
ncbi:MAG: hypothetical protein R3D44_05955 [Hyphomicrobiaceae bacterium]